MFHNPVEEMQQHEINYRLGAMDLLVVEEASMINYRNFALMHATLEKQIRRPLVIITGDKKQQLPLATIENRTVQDRSILGNPDLYHAGESNSLYTQFRCHDKNYQQFLDLLRDTRPSQSVLDENTFSRTIYRQTDISDEQIWQAKRSNASHVMLTVSRRGAARVNRIMVEKCFENADPITDVPLDNQEETFYAFTGLPVMITRNLDKSTGVVNGQIATIYGSHGRTLLLQLSNGRQTFTYPVTEVDDDDNYKTFYALCPSYCMTISKSEGATIDKLIVWMDCPSVPSGLGYVAVSRVRRAQDILFLTPLHPGHFVPVD